jgi:hypothetical protein
MKKKMKGDWVIISVLIIIGLIFLTFYSYNVELPRRATAIRMATDFCKSHGYVFQDSGSLCWRIINDTYEEREIRIKNDIVVWYERRKG